MKTYLVGNRIIACVVVVYSAFIVACSSSATATKTVETPEEKKLRIERARQDVLLVRHLGKSFRKSDSVEAVYDAQNLSIQKYEVFGEMLVLFGYSIEPDEIEGVMLAEALERGADAVLLQDLSFSPASGNVSVRGRLIKFK